MCATTTPGAKVYRSNLEILLIAHATDRGGEQLLCEQGQVAENAVYEPTIVALEIADRVEEMDSSPLTRQLMSVCLPIVSLEDATNQQAVFQ